MGLTLIISRLACPNHDAPSQFGRKTDEQNLCRLTAFLVDSRVYSFPFAKFRRAFGEIMTKEFWPLRLTICRFCKV